MDISDRNKWISHKGINILYNDMSNTQASDTLDIVNDIVNKAYQKSPDYLLILANSANTYVNAAIREALQKIDLRFQTEFKDFHVAVIGVNAAKRLIYNAINRRVYFAKNMEDAKDWLVSHVIPMH